MIATAADPRPLAPAVFRGVQEGFGDVPSFEVYNLTAPIPGHPINSTVSGETLEHAGYRLPERPSSAAQDREARSHAYWGTRRSLESRTPFAEGAAR